MKSGWKILIAVGLAIIASYLFGAEPQKMEKTQGRIEHLPTEGRLKDAFLIYNEEYFYGGLPTTTKIRLADLTEDDRMGSLEKLEDGTWLILIDIHSHPLEKEAEFTEIHEMCHLENHIRYLGEGVDGHGPNFQSCMLRVAQKGAFKDIW